MSSEFEPRLRPETADRARLDSEALRWTCDRRCLDFETTAELDPEGSVVAQAAARDALEFGILSRARGQNIYVRGVRGTGRRSLVKQVIEEHREEVGERRALRDHCYVHNFRRPDRPRLISLPSGQGREFKRRMREFARFVHEDLAKMLDDDALVAERRALEADVQQKIQEITGPLEKELEEKGLRLVQMQQGGKSSNAILPVLDGEAVPPAQLEKAVQDDKAPAEVLERYKELLPEYARRVEDVSFQVIRLQKEGRDRLMKRIEASAREYLHDHLARIRADFRDDGIETYAEEVEDDVIEERLHPTGELPDPAERYGVNIVHEAREDGMPPVVEEPAPTLVNLLGTVDIGWDGNRPTPPDYRGVRGGALLSADGGYLIIDVYDLLMEPGAWRSLMRTLRSGKLEIVPPELSWFRTSSLLNPDPIPIEVRVVLIGDARLYYLLDQGDPDFGDLFKVLADFDYEMDRDEHALQNYASVIAYIARTEKLQPFHQSAVGALAEHGARIASRGGKLTARFGRLGDLAREASFLAEREKAEVVTAEHVRRAVQRTKERASLPSRKFHELISRGVIRIETRGSVVGQVNGLAVISAGPINHGFPARITATIGVGQAGLIDIEASASLSGSIHTKGFHILGGLLRYLLRADHPLAFSASLAFEQSYGGIDGDSASGAEICCLLSALTDIPLRQDLAMTGAIDQHGHVQAIGGVNEKIEGFYDVCAAFGLTGAQGVIIPQSNASELMLRREVVEACENGEFHVYAVETIREAIEIFTGVEAGEWDEQEGGYPAGTVLARAVECAERYWKQASRSPRRAGKRSAQTRADEGEPGSPSDSPVPGPEVPSVPSPAEERDPRAT